jgi:hypothetical protein
MTKLNVFSKEMSAAEVKDMNEAGRSSTIEKTHDTNRHIKWEDILKKANRYGNIADIEITIEKDIGE